MNDLDQELRDLLEQDSRGAPPPAPMPKGLSRRVRRRQFGIALVAGATAVLLVGASFVVLRSMTRGDSATIATSNDLGERTATIQGFTVTAPAGWTLIDWRSTPRAGEEITPILQLSNTDSGLETTLCHPQGVKDGTAVLFVGIEAGNRPDGPNPPPWSVTVGWQPGSGPCGAGDYMHFTIGDTAYILFAGSGSDVSVDAQRQVLQFSLGGFVTQEAHPLNADITPAYVLASGVENEVAWRIEAGIARPVPAPGPARPQLSLTTGEAGRERTVSLSDGVSIGALGASLGERMLAVGLLPAGTVRSEYRAPGTGPIEAAVVDPPESLKTLITTTGGVEVGRIAWVIVDLSADAQLVAIAADGSEQPIAVVVTESQPSAADEAAQIDLRNALVAALTMYTDGETFVGFTPDVAATIEPGLTYNSSLTAVAGEISIRDVTKSTLVLVTKTVDGDVFCIADDTVSGSTTYGVLDVQTAADCHGGEGAWGIEPASPSPIQSPSPSLEPTRGHGVGSFDAFDSNWTLSAEVNDQGFCLYLTNVDVAVTQDCSTQPLGASDTDLPAIYNAGDSGPGPAYSFIYGLAPPGTDLASIVTTDRLGTVSILFPLPPIVGYEGTVFVFLMDLKGGDGTIGFYDASGTKIVSGPVSWEPVAAR